MRRVSALREQNPQNAGLHFLEAIGNFSQKDLGKAEVSVRQAMRWTPRPPAPTHSWPTTWPKERFRRQRSTFAARSKRIPRRLRTTSCWPRSTKRNATGRQRNPCGSARRRLTPGSPLVAQRLASLYLDHGGDLNVALSLAQIAKQKLPGLPATVDTLGWAYYKMGPFNRRSNNYRKRSRRHRGTRCISITSAPPTPRDVISLPPGAISRRP